MKTRKWVNEIVRCGAVQLRQRGSHRMFRMPDGSLYVVPVSGGHPEVCQWKVKEGRKHLGGLVKVLKETPPSDTWGGWCPLCGERSSAKAKKVNRMMKQHQVVYVCPKCSGKFRVEVCKT